MNENIKIEFINITADDEPVNLAIVAANVLLDPFYATEEDISSPFLLETSAYIESIRRIIFNGSISIDNLIEMLHLNMNLTDKQLFILKRDYVICYGIYELGKQINLDYLKSQNKSKFLGDVKVSLEVQNDPQFLTMTLKDAKDCLDAITGLLEDMSGSESMINTFVKGECNPNNKVSWREWWTAYPLRTVPMAATKEREYPNKKVSKVGPILGKYYGSYSEL